MDPIFIYLYYLFVVLLLPLSYEHKRYTEEHRVLSFLRKQKHLPVRNANIGKIYFCNMHMTNQMMHCYTV